jgi:hypothetical protein
VESETSSVYFPASDIRVATTLIIDYTGESVTGVALPVVITTSQEEGEWYRQHFSSDLTFSLAYVRVVPQSVLNEITELPLLKSALVRARMIEEHLPGKPETAQNATFSAGVGHDYASIIVDKRTSMKILKSIDKIVANDQSLKGELHEIEYKLK